MADYEIKAWRDNSANRGITITHTEPHGYDNVESSITLIEAEELIRFVGSVAEAAKTAMDLSEVRDQYFETEIY